MLLELHSKTVLPRRPRIRREQYFLAGAPLHDRHDCRAARRRFHERPSGGHGLVRRRCRDFGRASAAGDEQSAPDPQRNTPCLACSADKAQPESREFELTASAAPGLIGGRLNCQPRQSGTDESRFGEFALRFRLRNLQWPSKFELRRPQLSARRRMGTRPAERIADLPWRFQFRVLIAPALAPVLSE